MTGHQSSAVLASVGHYKPICRSLATASLASIFSLTPLSPSSSELSSFLS